MSMADVHIFTHEAMKTTFTLHLRNKQRSLAHDAAHQMFRTIDEIENALSRYRSGSDVSQINRMTSGQSLFISDTCYDCLRIALEVHVESGGLFDVTLGQQIEHRKGDLAGDVPDVKGLLMLDPDRPALHCIEAGREIDLGGIGKGFALDRIQQTLIEWGIESGLLSAGASTQLAFGEESWTINRTGVEGMPNLELQNEALSISGTSIQGSHIVSPRTFEQRSYPYERLWVIHKEAARADAWSTACLLMTSEELEENKKSIRIFTE